MKKAKKDEMKKNEDEMKKHEGRKFIWWSIALILSSIILHLILHDNKGSWENEFIEIILSFLAQLFSHFGIGILAIGILTMRLDLTHWREYFEKRLSNIVVKREYLKNLNQEDLLPLQTEVLKTYFKNDDIGGEEGFLQYFQKNLVGLVGSSYRTDVNMNLKISESTDNNEIFEIEEILSYICMNNGANFQKTIRYQPEDDEHYDTKNFTVVIQHNDFKQKDNPTGEIVFDIEELNKLKACDKSNLKKGFDLDISAYEKKGLKIMVIAKYSVQKNRFLGWRMSDPSNKINLCVNYPTDYKLQKEFFFNNTNYIEFQSFPGNYTLMINSWLLESEGIVIQLIKNDTNKSEGLPKPTTLPK